MNSFDKLKTKLAELFQLDQADLDFGIYRIMNARRDEITRFLERDLLPQVRKAFGEYKSSDKAEIQKELDKVAHGVKAAGMDPEQAPKVKELRARLAEAVDVTALENEVYDHLCSFFSRYYDEGDFISLRRYKEGVYAIPYEGEEVKLHWANHDQYYIKTTEYFRDYAFKLKARYKGESDRRVHFKIVEADTEKDNIKAAGGNDRRFIYKDLATESTEGTEELIIRFEYRLDENKERQDQLNVQAIQKILDDLNSVISVSSAADNWFFRLSAKASTDKNPNRTILEKHLNDYTKRNTFDYFIHKDLEGFLRRELDFYIKNEVMRLDDIEEESAPRVEQYLSKIKVIRRIAHKIIEFLAQIENFQKKLWLKKKFVVETNYCVTLDRVPEDLYPEIAANEAQREEWVRLFAIDEIGTTKDTKGTKKEKQESLFSEDVVVKYSAPPACAGASAGRLTVAFLKANDKLVLDTKFFDDDFKTKLIASIDDFDGQCDGVLVHSENFQALELLQERYREQVKCIYIDPPYNTGEDGFAYKDNYQHSSWISMCFDRIAFGLKLMSNSSILFISIDESEITHLRLLLSEMIGTLGVTGEFVWKKRAGGDMAAGRGIGLAMEHEYVVTAAKSHNAKYRGERKNDSGFSNPDDDPDGPWTTQDLTCNKTNEERPSLYYDLIDPKTGNVFKCSTTRVWSYEKEKMEAMIRRTINGRHFPKVLFPASPDQKPKLKKFLRERKSDYSPISSWLEKHKTDPRDADIINGFAPLNSVATKEFSDLFGEKPFVYPKAVALIKTFIEQTATESDISLDFFAGSGTTGHAVINLNREDNGNRKYILVEMGDHFDAVLKPRIQKVIYSENWKDGKPVPTTKNMKGTNKEENFRDFSAFRGSSHMFKYIRLESYEDALANIKLQRSKDQQRILFPEQENSVSSVSSVTSVAKSFRESYMLKYVLDVESRGSRTLLNIDNFDDPWNYKLLVGAGSVGETKPVNADLVETFNWLLGLKVRHIDRISGFQVVEGEHLNGEKVLVIWRKIRDLATEDTESTEKKKEKNSVSSEISVAKEKANRDLEAFFRKQQYNTLDSEFDVIYVNGDNNLMNVPLDPDKEGVEPRYKVRLIEEEFKRLMFDVKDV